MPFKDVKISKDMKFLLMKAQHPLQVLAGGITGVNHVLMGNVYNLTDIYTKIFL